MKIKINYGKRVAVLPEAAIERLGEVGSLELKVLVALVENPDREQSPAELARRFSVGESEIDAALDYWQQAGAIEQPSKAKAVSITTHRIEKATVSVVSSGDMPSYTGKEIEAIFAEHTELQSFVDECQRELGKLLSVAEINKLIGLVDYYRFSGDFVILLVRRCVEIGKGSVPYIVRTALGYYKDGVVTIRALEERIRRENESHAMESRLRTMMGWGSRALTAKEKRFVESWTEWKIPEDMLEFVYQITVDTTGAPSMPYMNKILKSWREAGYQTADEARAATELYRKRKAEQGSAGSSFDRDEFFEAAIRSSLERHKKSNS